MLTFYCPACWSAINKGEAQCSVCGYDLRNYEALSFEDKLLLALNHPIPEQRLLAIQLLGRLGSQAAIPGLEKILGNTDNDIFILGEAVIALDKIPGGRSREALEKARQHPYPIIRKLASSLMEKDMPNQKTCVILVRHGQTEWNRVERFRGRADVPLNETGIRQAEATGERVAGEWQPKAIYTSPLSRSVKTAEAIAKHFGLQVQPIPGLADIDYGEWQGLSPEEVRQTWREELANWYEKPHLARIPGGESLNELRERAMKTVNELIRRHPGETIVMVGHTVINRIILLGILGLGNDRFWRIKQDTCAINVFEAEDGEFTLVSLNDTCHLRSNQS